MTSSWIQDFQTPSMHDFRQTHLKNGLQSNVNGSDRFVLFHCLCDIDFTVILSLNSTFSIVSLRQFREKAPTTANGDCRLQPCLSPPSIERINLDIKTMRRMASFRASYFVYVCVCVPIMKTSFSSASVTCVYLDVLIFTRSCSFYFIILRYTAHSIFCSLVPPPYSP